MIDPQGLINLLVKALEAAPAPVDAQITSVHPEDAQKWSERYIIWYTDVRCYVLDKLIENPQNNIYYQIDRLVQESNSIKSELNSLCNEQMPPEHKDVKPKQKGIIIGTIKKA